MSEVAYQDTGSRVRGRNTDFPDGSMGASDSAQTQGVPLPLDLATIRQFSFGQVERSAIDTRPNTSGGPVNHSDFAVREDSWKRQTRDDLDFPLPSHTKQTIFYDFPRPGGLPTPDSGFSSPASFLPLRKDSLAQSSIADSDGIIEVNMSALQMEIGMAIGSPTQAPVAWQSNSYQPGYSPSPDISIESRSVQPPPKQKSKWKVFGGLFGGKKQTIQTQNFYQLRTERTPVEESHSHPPRQWTTSDQTIEGQKPSMQRSNTAPNRYSTKHDPADNPEIFIDGSSIDETFQSQQKTGLLDVDIPNVEMERYSVMFGNLLGKPSETTPSLLMRRQATLERLKVINDELALQEKELEEKEKQIRQPRRATSPQPTRSPAFSLFPNTPSRDSRVTRSASPNRLIRSNTSPAALSPSRPSFAPGPENEIHANLMEPGPHIPMTSGQYSSDTSSYESPASVIPRPLVLRKPDLQSVVVMAQAKAKTQAHTTTTISAQPQPHPHPLRTFSITRQAQLTRSPEDMDFPTPPATGRDPSTDRSQQSSFKATMSVSGSTTSQSDHSASASGSSVSTTEIAGFQALSTPSDRSPSPQPTSIGKQLPIPMSKFTAPPQTHKTRGRSQTTSSPSSSSKSQLPRPNSRARIAGPSEISGPTNLTAVPLPSSTSPKPVGSPAVRPLQQAAESDDDDEARIARLADVSIARQISVSRQQRQLLVPIKSSSRGKSVATSEDNKSSLPSKSYSSPGVRPAMRARASTVSASSPANKIHDQNFPSPVKNLQASGVNVAHLTSPLAAVERAATELSPSNSTSNLPRLKKKESRKDILHDTRKGSMPTLVVVSGSGRPQDNIQGWEGAMVTPRKDIGIAERRRRTRAEKLGHGNDEEQRKGHEHKKSEKVVVERM